MTRRKELNPRAHGLHVTEAAIMDRWDAGESAQDIAVVTGKSLAHVRQIIHTFGSQDTIRFNRMVVSGTRRLAAAIARTGQRWN